MKENVVFLINVLILNSQDFQTRRSEIKAKLNVILKNKEKEQKKP